MLGDKRRIRTAIIRSFDNPLALICILVMDGCMPEHEEEAVHPIFKVIDGRIFSRVS